MSWLLKLIGYVPAKEREGIFLDRSDCWEVRPWLDDHAVNNAGEVEKIWQMTGGFLIRLPALVPGESIFFLEYSGRPHFEVCNYFDDNSPEKTTKVEISGKWWPRCYHLPITEEHIKNLAELESMYLLDLEFVNKFCVYKDNDVFVEWRGHHQYPVYISKLVSEEKVKAFADGLGTQYKEYVAFEETG